MKFLILVAGTNDSSNADFLADRFAEGIKTQDASCEITKIRLKDLRIEHFSLDCYKPDVTTNDDFAIIEHAMKEAHGIVIASPIWNFSVPAHLKNVIDRMGSFGLDTTTRSKGTLDGKPFFLLFTGGAPSPAWKGLLKSTTMHIPRAIQYFGGSVLGTDFEGGCTKGKGQFGLVVHERPATLARVEKKGSSFTQMVDTFVKTGTLPLKQSVMTTMVRIVQSFMKRFL